MPGPRQPPLPFSVRSRSVVLVLACLGVAVGCVSSSQVAGPPPAKSLPTREAAVYTVRPRPWPQIVRSQGVLVADEVTSVGAKVAGSVAKVHFDLGDWVRAGDPLVELDREEFQLQVEQAEALLAQARSAIGLLPEQPLESVQPQNSPPVRQEQALWDEAKANLERSEQLRAQNVIAPAEFDQLVANEQVAAARYAGALNSAREKIAVIAVRQVELAVARDRLQNAVIVAPFDGLAQQRLVAPGGYLHVGDQIATIVRSDPLHFRGTVPEHHAQDLVVGQEVRLRIEGIAEPRVVRVTRISPALEQLSRSLVFEAELPNANQHLRTGLFAEAEIIVNPQAVALVVPHGAVVEFAGAEKVWKVTEGVAGEQEVLAGQRRADGIEILSGLSAGDVILRDGSQGIVANIRPLGGTNDPGAAEQRSVERTDLPVEPAAEIAPESAASG